MEKNSIILEKYIKNVIRKNNDDEKHDIRLKFFYNKKLNKILMLRRATSCEIQPTSSIYSPELIQTISSSTRLIEINTPFKTHPEELTTPKDVKNLLLNNIDRLTCSESTIAKLDTSTTIGEGEKDNQLYLERISINKNLRGNGLSHKLINYVKSSAINNGRTSISGNIVPLDPEGFREYCNRCNIIRTSPPNFHEENENKNYISLDDLFEIYKKLGFIVNKDNRKLSMNIDNNTEIPQEDKLCSSFTSYTKNPKTLIMF